MSDTAAAARLDPLTSSRWLVVRLAAQLVAERDRWALWIPVGLAIGVGMYFALDFEPAAWTGPAELGLAVFVALLLRTRPIAMLAAIGLALMAAGFTVGQLRTAMVAAPVLDRPMGPVSMQGQVLAVEPRQRGVRLTLRHLGIDGLEPQKTPTKVRVTILSGSAGARPGDWVSLRAMLRPPPEPAAPGAFDFAQIAFFRGLGAVGYARGGVTLEAAAGETGRTAVSWSADLPIVMVGRIAP